jgi:hypothetical protein
MRHMSLINARHALNNAEKNGPSRKLETQFKDLCKAVEYILAHLEKLESEKKSS